jgi:hypothetical protein
MMKNLDALSAFVLLLFAFWVCYLSNELSLWNSDGPGDGFFPFLAGLTLGLSGMDLLVKSLLKPKKTTAFWADTLKWKLFSYLGILIAYSVLFNWLGSLLATLFFFLFLCKEAEKFSWKTSLIFSGLSTCFFFVTFYMLLKAPLPLGLLKPLFLLWGF